MSPLLVEIFTGHKCVYEYRTHLKKKVMLSLKNEKKEYVVGYLVNDLFEEIVTVFCLAKNAQWTQR